MAANRLPVRHTGGYTTRSTPHRANNIVRRRYYGNGQAVSFKLQHSTKVYPGSVKPLHFPAKRFIGLDSGPGTTPVFVPSRNAMAVAAGGGAVVAGLAYATARHRKNAYATARRTGQLSAAQHRQRQQAARAPRRRSRGKR